MSKRLTAFLIMTAIFMVAPALAHNVSITDYEVPVSRATDFYLNFNYTGATSGSATVADTGSLTANFDNYYNSLPVAWSTNVSGTYAKNFGTSSHNVTFSTRGQRYPWETGDLYAYAGLTAAHANTYDQVASNLSLGAGYGRFINATAMAKAMRIEDFMLEEGETSGFMPKASMIELAKVIDRQGEFQTKYGATYKPKWYEAMEAVIKASGKLKGDRIGAVGILRIDEVLFTENIGNRFYGWDVYSGVGYQLTTSSPSVATSDPTIQIGARLAKPFGAENQWEENLLVTSTLNDFGNAYNASLTSSYLREISNRIDFTLTNILTLNKASANVANIFSNSINATFLYYIENRINLALSGTYSKTGDQDAQTTYTTAVQCKLY